MLGVNADLAVNASLSQSMLQRSVCGTCREGRKVQVHFTGSGRKGMCRCIMDTRRSERRQRVRFISFSGIAVRRTTSAVRG